MEPQEEIQVDNEEERKRPEHGNMKIPTSKGREGSSKLGSMQGSMLADSVYSSNYSSSIKQPQPHGNMKIPTSKGREGSSKLGSMQGSMLADSAYSSNYSSSIKQPQSDKASPKERCRFSRFKKLSSNHSAQPKHPVSLLRDSKEGHAGLDRSHEKAEHFGEIHKNEIQMPRPRPRSVTDKNRFKGHESKPRSQPEEKSCAGQESKAASLATLAQALGLVDQFKKHHSENVDKSRNESDLNTLATNLLEACKSSNDSSVEFHNLTKDDTSLDDTSLESLSDKLDVQDGFCVAVSLLDGLVMNTTSSITSVLGYPKDMWIGRSLIDFIHQDDRETVSNHVTQNISLPLRNITEVGQSNINTDPKANSGTFFCRIRAYNGLRSGFSIKKRKTQFRPFKMSVCFSEVERDTSVASTKTPQGSQIIYMFMTAIPIISAYTESFQVGLIKLTTGNQGFASKHNAQGKFTWFDESAIAFTGFLPQNIIGADIFDYFHPTDLGIIKETFDLVMKEPGKPCRSKPYRLKINNGGFITVTSWWSSFVNPWSKQMEFIHGKHTVTQGPKMVDIFENQDALSEEIPQTVSKQAHLSINEILRSMSKAPVPAQSVIQINQVNQTSKNKKELAGFMGSLMEEVAKAENFKKADLKEQLALPLDNITPHYSDSSDSPPSYTQLTYNENLMRFFNSQPQTLTEREANQLEHNEANKLKKEYFPSKIEVKVELKPGKQRKNTYSRKCSSHSLQQHSDEQQNSGSGEGTGQNSSTLPTGLSAGQPQHRGDDGSCSPDDSGSGSGMGSGSRGSRTYNGPSITVELMETHNKDMEMKMLCQFKEAKRTSTMRLLRDSVKQEAKKRSISAVLTKPPTAKAIIETDMTWQMKEAQQPLLTGPSFKGISGISVPTVYFPVSQTLDQMQPGIMVQGTSYVPLGMMYQPAQPSQQQARQQQAERPSCLVMDTSGVKQDSSDQPPCGEPKQSQPSYSTSNSSLYSFLKTSSDVNTGYEEHEDENQKVKIVRKIPLLKEPFWNTRVEWNNDLQFKFTMERAAPEDLLHADQQKLRKMVQPDLVTDQLEIVLEEFDEGVLLEEFLEDFHGPPSDDETDAETEDPEEKSTKERRKRNHMEKMNIFMEAEATFPKPQSSQVPIWSTSLPTRIWDDNFNSDSDSDSSE